MKKQTQIKARKTPRNKQRNRTATANNKPHTIWEKAVETTTEKKKQQNKERQKTRPDESVKKKRAATHATHTHIHSFLVSHPPEKKRGREIMESNGNARGSEVRSDDRE